MSFDGSWIQRDVMLAQNGVDAILLALKTPHQIEAMLREPATRPGQKGAIEFA